MGSARAIRPTDLVALVAYDGKVFPNEAITRDRVGKEASPHPLETAIEQWFSFATGRHTLISVKGAALRGLVSARKRASNIAWEIDCLIQTEPTTDVILSLLDQATEDAGRAGAEKIFLRLDADSHILRDCSSAGFAYYLREHIFVREGSVGKVAVTPFPPGMALRRWSKADAHDAYRLYNRATPEPVRMAEAVTFREWSAARDRISTGRGTRQWVLESRDGLVAWLRTAADGELGRFDIMAELSAAGALGQLVDAALARLSQQSVLLTLVPDFATGLADHLRQRGFTEHGEFVVLSKRTVRPLRVKETVKRAVPVRVFPT